MSRRCLCLFLSSLLSCGVSAKSQTDINLSNDAAFISGSFDLRPVHTAISELSAIIKTALNPKVSNNLSIYSDMYMANSILDAATHSVRQLKLQLDDMGLARGSRIKKRNVCDDCYLKGSRYKRGALDMVSDLSDQIFGFVGATKFRQIKKSISNQYKMDLSTLTKVSENRLAILRINKLITDTKNQLQESSSNSQIFFVCLKITTTIAHLNSLINTLHEIRISGDNGHLSRWIINESSLKHYILSLTDNHSSLRPLFSSSEVDKYFRIKIATTHSNSSHIEQIARIPLMTTMSKFKIRQKGCKDGLMCFVNGNFGTSIPMHDYFECVGANIANIMVSCDTRPCKTTLSEEIVCHNLNSTSFILASAKQFDLKIHCGDKISVAKINKVTLLRVPHSCWVASDHVIIDPVYSKKLISLPPVIVDIPFSKAKGFHLKENSSSLLNSKLIMDELEKIILPAKGFNFTDEMSISDHLSISANVIGGVTIALIVMVFIMHAWKKYFGKKHQDKKNTLAYLFE